MKKIFMLLVCVATAMLSIKATARDPERGYRGFVDLSASAEFKKKYIYGSHDIVYSISGVTTTHGYQFDRHFFAGGGAGLVVQTSNYDWFALGIGLPVYAAGRADWKIGKVPLFADIRLGIYITSYDHIPTYIIPSIGYRCSWGSKVSLNMGIGLSLHRFGYDDGSHWKLMPSVKIGIEFQ